MTRSAVVSSVARYGAPNFKSGPESRIYYEEASASDACAGSLAVGRRLGQDALPNGSHWGDRPQDLRNLWAPSEFTAETRIIYTGAFVSNRRKSEHSGAIASGRGQTSNGESTIFAASQSTRTEAILSGNRELRRVLSRSQVLAIVVGSVVGTGIYIRPASIAQLLGSAGSILCVWLAAGALSLCGALTYAQLAMRPHRGRAYCGEHIAPKCLPASDSFQLKQATARTPAIRECTGRSPKRLIVNQTSAAPDLSRALRSERRHRRSRKQRFDFFERSCGRYSQGIACQGRTQNTPLRSFEVGIAPLMSALRPEV